MSEDKQRPCQGDALMCLEGRKQLEISWSTSASVFRKVVVSKEFHFPKQAPLIWWSCSGWIKFVRSRLQGNFHQFIVGKKKYVVSLNTELSIAETFSLASTVHAFSLLIALQVRGLWLLSFLKYLRAANQHKIYHPSQGYTQFLRPFTYRF